MRAISYNAKDESAICMIFIEVNISVDQLTMPPRRIPHGKISIRGSRTLTVTQMRRGGGDDLAHENKTYAPAGLREKRAGLSIPDTLGLGLAQLKWCIHKIILLTRSTTWSTTAAFNVCVAICLEGQVEVLLLQNIAVRLPTSLL